MLSIATIKKMLSDHNLKTKERDIMLSISTIKKMLSDRNLKQISETIGVAYPTLLALADRQADHDHNLKTIRKVSAYLIDSNKPVLEKRIVPPPLSD